MRFWTKRDARPGNRPAVEPLEGRRVPATFHVSSAADLQADVAALANSSGANTIVINPGVYNLTGVLRIENAGNLTIVGKTTRAGSVTLLAATGNRAIEVDGGNVTLQSLTVAGGGNVDRGGGILAQNTNLTLKGATVSGNTAQIGGGVFANGGALTVQSSSIVNNGAVQGASVAGAGIGASNAAITITRSTVNNNAATSDVLDTNGTASAIGAGLYAEGGTISIAKSSFAHNTVYAATTGPSATSTGGAVATRNASVAVDGSNVTGNGLVALSAGTNREQGSAFSTNGGTLTITNSTLGGNLPGGTAQFDHPGATVVLKNTTVEGQKLIASRTLSS